MHGEYRHLHAHAQLARQTGLESEAIFLLEDGDVLEITPESGTVVDRVAVGRVLVDGKAVGDVEDTVLRDRQHLAQDGMMLVTLGVNAAGDVSGPEILTRGFTSLVEATARGRRRAGWSWRPWRRADPRSGRIGGRASNGSSRRCDDSCVGRWIAGPCPPPSSSSASGKRQAAGEGEGRRTRIRLASNRRGVITAWDGRIGNGARPRGTGLESAERVAGETARLLAS